MSLSDVARRFFVKRRLRSALKPSPFKGFSALNGILVNRQKFADETRRKAKTLNK